MRVEIPYFTGCPNYAPLPAQIAGLLAGAGIAAEVQPRVVESDRAAQDARFLGSPSVRINGYDVEPGAEARTDYGLKCRLYRTADGISGRPADHWILAAARHATTQSPRAAEPATPAG
ncbi:MAG: DF family (seleno)protein [Solirubrobacteraceae bacterium]